MTYYSEYLNSNLTFDDLTAKRKEQLQRISRLRGADVLVFASDFGKMRQADITIGYSDLLPIYDQISQLSSDNLDLILETPGGSGETAEEIVKILRKKYKSLRVIVPGHAMSAGTLIAMAADEIVMGDLSALGPIDAQIGWQGKVFSADALLKGFDRIKADVASTNVLNKVYIPILQGISPGELEHAKNALDFAKTLVEDWLYTYKFKNWDKHKTTNPGQPVTESDRRERAKEIAEKLGDHGTWKTHGRPIKIDDLRALRLLITDYTEQLELSEAISRYYTLLKMTFEGTSIYKVFETAKSQIFRYTAQPPPASTENVNSVIIELNCPNCGNRFNVQANLEKGVALQKECIAFPANNFVKCKACNADINLEGTKRQIEAQTKKTVIIG